jgi:hypothetical protein
MILRYAGEVSNIFEKPCQVVYEKINFLMLILEAEQIIGFKAHQK